MQYFFADAPMKKKLKILCTRGYSTFWTPSTNFFFPLIKKIFLQTLVEIISRYHDFFLGFWDPLGPPYGQNENFYIWGDGYQNRVKRVRWVHFWRNFWKIFKNEGFGLFWTPSTIFFCFNQKYLFTTPIWNNF